MQEGELYEQKDEQQEVVKRLKKETEDVREQEEVLGEVKSQR